MPSTIGPLFALRGHFKADLSGEPWTQANQIVFETSNGQFYNLEIASSLLREKFHSPSEELLYVAQILREDAEILFAFDSLLERALFLELRDFDSVGPKTAALLVASLGAIGIKEMLERGLPPGFKVSGLGPKTMEKISVGLKQQREKFIELFSRSKNPLSLHGKTSGFEASSTSSSGRVPLDLLQALEKLGLRSQDVEVLWADLSNEGNGFEKLEKVEKIRQLLQAWGRSKSRNISYGGTEA